MAISEVHVRHPLTMLVVGLSLISINRVQCEPADENISSAHHGSTTTQATMTSVQLNITSSQSNATEANSTTHTVAISASSTTAHVSSQMDTTDGTTVTTETAAIATEAAVSTITSSSTTAASATTNMTSSTDLSSSATTEVSSSSTTSSSTSPVPTDITQSLFRSSTHLDMPTTDSTAVVTSLTSEGSTNTTMLPTSIDNSATTTQEVASSTTNQMSTSMQDSTTDANSVITLALTTTDAPVTTTDGSVTTTDAPVTTTDAPITTEPILTRNPDLPPNILFILSDDYSERPEHKIPNLDRLRAESVFFPRAYANWPKCSPSRTSLMSGRTNGDLRAFGGWVNIRNTPEYDRVVSMPGYFKDHGYFTAGFGKTFHDNDPKKHDGKKSWSRDHWPLKTIKKKLKKFEKRRRPQSKEKMAAAPDPVHNDTWFLDHEIASRAIKLMTKLRVKKGHKPWFINVGFRLPHEPWQVPIKYWDRFSYTPFLPEHENLTQFPPEFPPVAAAYSENAVWSRMMNERQTLGSLKPLKYQLGVDYSPYERLPVSVIMEMRRGYAAAINFMDAQIGRLLDYIRSSPDLSNNTIVVFTSDHGYHLSELGIWKKQTIYEYGVRVPLYIRDPRFVSNHGSLATTTMAELVDIYPTLADLAGLPVPTDLSGVSLAPTVRDSSYVARSSAVSQVSRCHPSKKRVRNYPWARNECNRRDFLKNPKRDGVEIMGFSIRTSMFRLTTWLPFNYKTGAAYWHQRAEAVELFDHRQDLPHMPVIERDNLALSNHYLAHIALLRIATQERVVTSRTPRLFQVIHVAGFDVGLSDVYPQTDMVFASMMRKKHVYFKRTDFETCIRKCARESRCKGMVVLENVCKGLSKLGSSVPIQGMAALSLRKLKYDRDDLV
eukprot:TRINITY_DN12349_c2_g1_i4.p1 TRINITY_DN12349_c2_g1~~TRINITY_DN12349_c2_g1_i4.p1  ORF type:complete len:890 (+),score=164.54 TRINITY_DN12349_c2_g1_i4:318-2987(+)